MFKTIEGVTLMGELETTATNGGSLHLNLNFSVLQERSRTSNKGLQVAAVIFSPGAEDAQLQSQTAAAVTG